MDKSNYFLKNLKKKKKNLNLYFTVMSIKNKLTPELYFSKNFTKLKSFKERKFKFFNTKHTALY